MAINFPDNIKINVGNPIDSRYLSSGNTPYVSTGETNAAIVMAQRYVGLTVNINNVEYWYKDGINDTDLIEKIFTGGGTITGATNGLMIDGVNDKDIALGGDLITGTTINGVGLYDLNITNVDGFLVSTSGDTAQIILEPNGITLAFSGVSGSSSVSLENGGGLQYDSDYSANYTPRSLVDAGYVSGFTSNNFLKLDQTSGQTVVNGMPTFEEGIMFGTTPSASQISGHTKGKLYYDNCYETLSVQIGDESTLQIGQESLTYVWNDSGSVIPNGAVVRAVGTHCGGGSTADVTSVCLAKADTMACAVAIGVATEEIGVNEYGYITVRGYVSDLDTTIGSYSGITPSQLVYLSPTIAGGVTNIPPDSPNIKVQLGRLTTTGTTGKLSVQIDVIYRLDDLADVSVPSPSVDDVLKWNGLCWVNATVGTTSAGSGVNFYYATPIINSISQPAGLSSDGTLGNGVQVMSLSKTPITSGGTQYTCGCVNAAGTYAFVAWLYDTPLGRTVIDSGTWDFTAWLCVSQYTGTEQIINNIYQVVPISGITISACTTYDALATVTNGAFAGTYFSASTVNTNASWLQTPSGIYQICAKVDNNNVCIVKPNGAGVTGGTGNVWNRLFGATGPDFEVAGTYDCYTTTLAEPSFAITCTDKLGRIGFGYANASRTFGVTYNGSTQASYFKTPLITLHNDLAGLQGGSGTERYHLDASDATLIGDITASAAEINVLDGIPPTLNSTELGYVDGVTSPIQDQLDGKIDSITSVGSGTTIYSGITGQTLVLNNIIGSGATTVSKIDNTVVIYSSGGTGVEKFTSDLVVSIAAGKTFGKYENGDTIPASGKTPAEVIQMALVEALEPTVVLGSTSTNVVFGLSAKTVNLCFNYTINTLGASVDCAFLEYCRTGDAGWVTLSTGTTTPDTYLHNIDDSVNRFCTNVLNYKYTVVDTAGATGTTTYNVTPQAYAVPTYSPTYTGSVLGYETQTLREKGNTGTTIAGSVSSNRSLVYITGYNIQRSVDGGGFSTIVNCSGLCSLNPSITSCLDTGAAGSANSICYRIQVYDDYCSVTPNNSGTYTINFRFASYYGYCNSTSISGAQVVALGNQALCPTRARTMTLTAPAGDYTYVAYPESYGWLTSAIMDGAAPVLGAFSCCCDNSVTNYYGQAVDYIIYKSNAPEAFTSNSVAFS